MNKYVASFLLPLSIFFAYPAVADDSEALLERNKTLDSMNFRSEQLKIQASMAESYKKMADAGFIVDENGKPLGVENLVDLGVDVRKKGGVNESGSSEPFDPSLKGGAPWPMDQSLFGSGNPGQGQATASGGIIQGGGAGGSGGEEQRQILTLTEIRANSVMVRTNEGIQEVRVGQKVYNMKLQKFDVDSAYFTGPTGTKVLSIDWAASK